MAASVVGWLLSALINDTSLELRFLVEGGFGYIDCLLVIVCAMVFIKGLQNSGALDYLTAVLVKTFRKFPTILLIIFMAILMLPGMVTGSSTAGVISAGIIVAPIMIKMGMPRKRVAGFIGIGAILGMVAPPINIPVMVICDVVDIAYNGFEVPLLLLTVPVAIFSCIYYSRSLHKYYSVEEDHPEAKCDANGQLRPFNFTENLIITGLLVLAEVFFVVKYFAYKGTPEASPKTITFNLILMILMGLLIALTVFWTWVFRPYCHEIDIEEMGKTINLNITKEISWTCLLPLLVIVLIFVAQSIWPKVIGILATPLYFIIAFIPTIFCGKKFKIINCVDDAVKNSLGVMGLLMGVGMFIEVMTLSGGRGNIVILILSLMTKSKPLLFLALAVSMTLFGGISSFASASIFGGPFVMALYPTFSFIIVSSACSLIAALGEFLPPTAMSARLAAKNINDIKLESEDDLKYMSVTKKAAIPLSVILVWAMLFIIVASKYYG